tara:strand:+ start:383 stop:499 length:117 start_codon:yes stop_codon:yes gene_type:complete
MVWFSIDNLEIEKINFKAFKKSLDQNLGVSPFLKGAQF